jgi:hypothetical protein
MAAVLVEVWGCDVQEKDIDDERILATKSWIMDRCSLVKEYLQATGAFWYSTLLRPLSFGYYHIPLVYRRLDLHTFHDSAQDEMTVGRYTLYGAKLYPRDKRYVTSRGQLNSKSKTRLVFDRGPKCWDSNSSDAIYCLVSCVSYR